MCIAVGAGHLVCSLHIHGVVVIPGYGGYGSEDASHLRERLEVDHANLIVMIARLSRPSETKVHYAEAREFHGVDTEGFARDLVTHGFILRVSKDDLLKPVPLFIMES